MSEVQFDREKLKAVVLYTASKCGPGRLGAVKLHKVLYFVDMLRYADAGCAVTGATYRKRPFGPMCVQLQPTILALQASGALRVEEVNYFGYRKKEYVALQDPEPGRLSVAEKELLDEVIAFVCDDNSAKTISEFSHNRAWEMAEFDGKLPYYSVFNIFPTQVPQEAIEATAAEVAQIEAERPSGKAVGSSDYRAFRSRILEKMEP